MAEFGQTFRVPDFWQAEAVAHLKAGRDVVLHAPTGTGKTFVFESYFSQYGSRATFTVPTRALANDKYAQWSAEGWRVGISTGDRLENPDAPLLVATLETRRESILSGEMRGLFVIDEYQLLGDESRGAAYETAIAALPRDCQLLLMSGSVENSADVVKWLRRIGRDAVLVRHDTRAVPIEEVCAAALPETSARGIRGFWPNIASKLADVEHIAQTTHVKVVIVQIFQLCRKTAAIRVVHLNHAAIGNSVEIIVIAVDEPNVRQYRFGFPDAPPADARLWDGFKDFYAFKLDSLAVIIRKFKEIPVPGGGNGVSAIGRQILFGNLPAF